jgi:hypothetical protein
MSKAKLATFRIDENDWDAFQGWAKAKGTNASSELIGFVQACIGKGDRLSVPEQLDNDIDGRIDKLRAEMKAAIAPIIARLEKLEQLSNTGIPVTESEQAEQPLLDYLEINQAIAIDTPDIMSSKADEVEVTPNPPETTIKPIAGDFSRGLIQAELQRRLGLKNASDLSRKKRDSEKMATLKDRDPDELIWEWDELKELYFPVG